MTAKAKAKANPQTPETAGRGPAVVYFAKAPIPGQVKTRLCPPLNEVEAAALYAAFLKTLVVPFPGARTFVYGWPEDQLERLAEALPVDFGEQGIELRPQRGLDLFARMDACLHELLAEGHSPVLIRNTDSPDLPLARVFEGLARAAPGRLVLGPDPGGGYYLLALSEPCRELLSALSKTQPEPAQVLAATCQRAKELGLEVELQPEEPDVDSYEDLVEMWQRRLRG